MQVYKIVTHERTNDDRANRYYSGATESTKVAKEISKEELITVSVYEFTTPKVVIDKTTFLASLNEEAWCDPQLIAEFVNGKTQKV